MYDEKFRRMAYVLGKEHTIEVLRYLYEHGWSKASDVAEEYDFHIATATKYLKELKEIGLAEERTGRGKTGDVQEYNLKDPQITLHLDLSDTSEKGGELRIKVEFYRELLNSLLTRSKGFYGTYPLGLDKVEEIDKIDIATKNELIDSIRKIIDFNEEKIGVPSTKRLVNRAGKKVVEDHKEWVESMRLLEELPSRYKDVLEDR